MQKKYNSKQRFKGLLKVNPADNPLIKSNNQFKTLVFPKENIVSTIESGFFHAGNYGTKVNAVTLLKDVEIRDHHFTSDVELTAKFIWTQDNLLTEISKGTKIIFKGKSFAPRYDKANYEPEVPRNLIDANDGVGTTEEGGTTLKTIFGEKVFEYPKPPSLIEYLINFLCEDGAIILDSFAGSGTTAHAVLNLNNNGEEKEHRKFILVEMEDYAETITAERVRRVINGYGEGKNAVPGTGGGFSFYELGEPLMLGEYINEKQPVEKIQEYIWYTETRTPFAPPKHKYYLGKHQGSDYYFYYEKDRITTLSYDTLDIVVERAEQYVIYADQCLIDKADLLAKNIVFKKIPRDICKF